MSIAAGVKSLINANAFLMGALVLIGLLASSSTSTSSSSSFSDCKSEREMARTLFTFETVAFAFCFLSFLLTYSMRTASYLAVAVADIEAAGGGGGGGPAVGSKVKAGLIAAGVAFVLASGFLVLSITFLLQILMGPLPCTDAAVPAITTVVILAVAGLSVYLVVALRSVLGI